MRENEWMFLFTHWHTREPRVNNHYNRRIVIMYTIKTWLKVYSHDGLIYTKRNRKGSKNKQKRSKTKMAKKFSLSFTMNVLLQLEVTVILAEKISWNACIPMVLFVHNINEKAFQSNANHPLAKRRIGCIVNRFERVQMGSLGREMQVEQVWRCLGRWEGVVVRSPCGKEEGARTLYGLTDTTENIIFLELCWRAVKKFKAVPDEHSEFNSKCE